jgi:hypothetical protein
MKTIGKITQAVRMKQKLSRQSFRLALAEKVAGSSLTRQRVAHWEQAKAHPDLRLLLAMVLLYEDWRQEWALDCLGAAGEQALQIEAGQPGLPPILRLRSGKPASG